MKQPWESTRPHSGASGSESTQRTAGQSPPSEAGAAASTAACALLPHRGNVPVGMARFGRQSVFVEPSGRFLQAG